MKAVASLGSQPLLLVHRRMGVLHCSRPSKVFNDSARLLLSLTPSDVKKKTEFIELHKIFAAMVLWACLHI